MDMYPSARKSSKDTEEEKDDTALLPKSMFGGDCKVGDVYKVKVVAIHEDELEVEPAGEDKSDKKEKSEKSETMDDDMMNPVDKMMM